MSAPSPSRHRARPVLALLTCNVVLLVGACQPVSDQVRSPVGVGGTGPGTGGSPAGTGGASAPPPLGTGGSSATGGAGGGTVGPSADAEVTDDSAPVASDASAAPTPDAIVTPPPAGSSPGCGLTTPLPAEGYHTIKVGAGDRRFFLRLPAAAASDRQLAWPVIFAFHGSGNKDGNWFDTNTGLRKENEERAVLVFGESLFRPGSTSNRSWQDESQLADNLAYLDATIDWLKGQLCVDGRRLFAVGQSSGAYFSQTLACHRGDLLRAVATSDGGERYFRDCKGNPSVFVRFRPAGVNAADNRRAIDFWMKHNGCAAAAGPATGVGACQAHPGCKQGMVLWSCSDGEAHDWPSYMDRGVWTFFSGLK